MVGRGILRKFPSCVENISLFQRCIPSATLSTIVLAIMDRKHGQYEPTPFGKEMLKHFPFASGYKNMNHGK